MSESAWEGENNAEKGEPHSSTHAQRARWKKTNKDKHAHTNNIPVIMRRPVRLYRSPEITMLTTVNQTRDARSVANRQADKKENRRGNTVTWWYTQRVPTKLWERRRARKIEILVSAVRDGDVAVSTVTSQRGQLTRPAEQNFLRTYYSVCQNTCTLTSSKNEFPTINIFFMGI